MKKGERKNNRFPEHFTSFIKALNKHKVKYLLIGGYAMGVYGKIRGTGDLDIIIQSTPENAEKMMAACNDYGIPKEDLAIEMFLIPKMIGIGDPPLRIEIMKKLDSLDFSYAYQRKKVHIIDDDVKIDVISLDDLLIAKKDALKSRNTARDFEDVAYLQKLAKNSDS